jgi:23S rRNA (uracil1939-C5)-methyltransferase
MLKIGQVLELNLEQIVAGGEAIAHHEGMAVFVPYGAPGDRVVAKVISVKPHYARALIQSFLQEGPGRVAPRCPVFGRCGCCQLQHLSYEAQLEAKHSMVSEAMVRIAKVDASVVEPVVGSQPWYYRNKVHWAVAERSGGYDVGLYEARSHQVVDTTHCYIQHPLNNLVLDFMRSHLGHFGFPPYRNGKGWLRSVFAKVGHHTEDLMIGIVGASKDFSRKEEWVADIRTQFPGVRSIVFNINTNPGNVLMGKTTMVLWGEDSIRERIADREYQVSARSFFQVNSLQVEELYRQIARLADLKGTECVIDAYSGTGSISLYLAKHAKEVIAIEEVPEATRNARQNAQGLSNVQFITGLVEDVLPELTEQITPDVVVVDPPRKGCERSVLETLAKCCIPKVVYVSCNPATLARDIAILSELGYALKCAVPVDMFPQTAHVECVALIERVKD